MVEPRRERLGKAACIDTTSISYTLRALGLSMGQHLSYIITFAIAGAPAVAII